MMIAIFPLSSDYIKHDNTTWMTFFCFLCFDHQRHIFRLRFQLLLFSAYTILGITFLHGMKGLLLRRRKDMGLWRFEGILRRSWVLVLLEYVTSFLLKESRLFDAVLFGSVTRVTVMWF